MSIKEFVKSLFADNVNFPAEGMTQTDVTCSILRHRNKEVTPENIKKEQPNASRALTALFKEKLVMVNDERTYFPVTPETAQQEALTQFSENVYCIKGDIYAVVDTMYLIKVHSDHVFAATEYLRRYLGPDRYFDIFYSNSYLWVLWESQNSDEDEFRTVYHEISNAVAISYERYIESQRKLIKLQKTQASTSRE